MKIFLQSSDLERLLLVRAKAWLLRTRANLWELWEPRLFQIRSGATPTELISVCFIRGTKLICMDSHCIYSLLNLLRHDDIHF